jgi:hypothetical protein
MAERASIRLDQRSAVPADCFAAKCKNRTKNESGMGGAHLADDYRNNAHAESRMFESVARA